MSEDVGVKAPVTRMRRRLSMETDEVKSPAGTTTPTKKKGGRLATKPQLDLIIENDAEQVPKRSTRKTTAKDITEPIFDDKPMTPSRRSARIRSNTSLVSETTQSLDSPRAKRAAARRTSQAGSDNDAPITPARQVRRARKDSTSSIDKQGDKSTNKTSATPEIIVEEQETINELSSVKDGSLSKSPQGRGRKGKRSSLSQSTNETVHEIYLEKGENLNTSSKKNKQVINEESSESIPKTASKDEKDKDIPKKNLDNVDSSFVLTNYLEEKPRKRNSILHKSTSAIEDSKNFKTKRHRTKSGCTFTENTSNECNFFSDNEIYKKKKKDKSLDILPNSKTLFNDYEIAKNKSDTSLTKSHKTNKENETQSVTSNSRINTEDGDNDRTKLETSTENVGAHDKSMSGNESSNNSITKTGWKKNIISQIESMIESPTSTASSEIRLISPKKCFETESSKNIQSVILTENDSESNACNSGSMHPVPQQYSEDQCVPVVKHSVHNDNNEQIPCDKSFEPMDIDESIHQSISINQSLKNSPKTVSQLQTQKQFSMSMELSNDCSNVNSNKSKRKSSLSSESHNLEKSSCENKSTLILSQIKDTSCSDINGKLQEVYNKEQLSKSVDILDKIKKKEAEKKKLSLDYSTSTPLQQKSMKKLGLPMDTSIISPRNKPKSKITNVDKEESIDNREKFASKKESEHSNKQSSVESDNDFSETDDSGAEVTKTQNEFIDEEADEASEDYQSGDSQDEDERQYEEENEIVEKGETLDTDEEFSDDTDYEKDSFVVSSDEEDNSLLSGSGDDLSVSDNELSMSARSKKKYNERKVKEQKIASKEMFEARHKLDNSNKDVRKTKYKKNNRQRLESSSESEEEITVQSKKSSRQRIDSSRDLSDVKLEESASVMKKNKRKRLSESVYSESALSEKEITVCNENKMDIEDPISITIKHETKTPQKENNLSAVLIKENIEEVNIVTNTSIINPNETSDPLQASMHMTDDSSSSEDNKEIINNYNSVLEGLNTNSKKTKKHDISLNINKKQKKVNEPIIDQLNLTQIKLKKDKNKSNKVDTESSQKEPEETHKINENSVDKDDEESDSIDMRLLFTEDSNDSVSNNSKEVNAMVVNNKDKDYIPLKKTEAKTNILENMDMSTEMNSSSQLNESQKKSKMRTSSQYTPEEDIASNNSDIAVSFFIDTTGAKFDMDKSIDTSNNSTKKKKKRNSTICDNNIVENDELPVDCDKNVMKTPKKSLNGTENLIDALNNVADVPPCLSTNTSQSGKKKKKEKHSLTNTTQENEIQNDEIDKSENMEESFFIDTVGTRLDMEQQISNSSKKKNKRNSTCDNTVGAEDLHVANEENIKVRSTKKNNKANKSSTIDVEENETPNYKRDEGVVPVKTPQSHKKKNKSLMFDETVNKPMMEAQAELVVSVKTPQSGKKKNKSILLEQSEIKSTNDTAKEQQETDFVSNCTSDKKKTKAKKSLTNIQNESTQDEKSSDVLIQFLHKKDKTRKSCQSNVDTQATIPLECNKSDDEGDAPVEVFYQSGKRENSVLESQEPENVATNDVSINTSSNSAKKQKQKSILNTSESAKDTKEVDEMYINRSNEEDSSKKRKRKHSATIQEYLPVGDDNNTDDMPNKLNESTAESQKKKRKLTKNKEEICTQNQDSTQKDTKETSHAETFEPKKLKKNKHVIKKQNIQISENETGKTYQNKKRKDRDDDAITNVSKIFKQDFLNKGYVTRLPSHILNQLGDKSNKNISEAKKTKIISTTEFKVEETKVRRNKPSSYLEESIYINDDTFVEKNTKKYSIKNPRVLPFIPTASTSDSGFTTNFRINFLPRETRFVAQATNVVNFKNDFLQQQKVKKFRTFEKYKNQRNVKLSKF